MARDITQLHPEAQRLALLLVEKCKEQGLIIKITDCVRSKAEQDALYAQGRTAPGSIVTNVKYPNSRHNWGDAFDFCRNDGKGAYNDSDGFFAKVGAIGKSLGLEWGGDWKSIVDKPHFQLAGLGSTCSRLKAKFGTPDKYKATWETKKSEEVTYKMKTLKYGSTGNDVTIFESIMKKMGYYTGEIDTHFGPKCVKACNAFQKDHPECGTNGEPDDSWGPKCWRKSLSLLDA